MTAPRYVFIALALLVTNLLNAFGGDAHTDDAAKMKGAWVAEKVTSSGREVPSDKFPFELHFEDATLTFKFVGKTTGNDRVHEIVIDPTMTPATIEITRNIRGTKETVRGIYKFDGDKLMICSLRGPDRKPSSERPKMFESSRAVPTDLLILKRRPEPNQ